MNKALVSVGSRPQAWGLAEPKRPGAASAARRATNSRSRCAWRPSGLRLVNLGLTNDGGDHAGDGPFDHQARYRRTTVMDAPASWRHAGGMRAPPRSSRTAMGILLTGGQSRRMGFDKASMLVGGVACAARVAAVMQAVVADAVEVGPGVSGLRAVREDPPGGGPLVAVCA